MQCASILFWAGEAEDEEVFSTRSSLQYDLGIR
jgi:hypothetical protein